MIKIDDLKSEAAKVVGVPVLSLLRDNYTLSCLLPISLYEAQFSESMDEMTSQNFILHCKVFVSSDQIKLMLCYKEKFFNRLTCM